MKQHSLQPKQEQSHNIENTTLYELPETAFKFNYLQAQDPDYAERLVDEVKEKRK